MEHTQGSQCAQSVAPSNIGGTSSGQLERVWLRTSFTDGRIWPLITFTYGFPSRIIHKKLRDLLIIYRRAVTYQAHHQIN